MGSVAIVRVQKFTAGSVRGIEIHDCRKKDVSHTNDDINFERTKNNYDLHSDNTNFTKAIKNRIDKLNLKKAVRKDAIVTEYDETLVNRLLQKITVFDNHFVVEFKSGVSATIDG